MLCAWNACFDDDDDSFMLLFPEIWLPVHAEPPFIITFSRHLLRVRKYGAVVADHRGGTYVYV